MKPGRLVAVLALSASALAAQGKRTIAVGDTVRDSLTRRDALLSRESTYTQQWRLAGRAARRSPLDHLRQPRGRSSLEVTAGRRSAHVVGAR